MSKPVRCGDPEVESLDPKFSGYSWTWGHLPSHKRQLREVGGVKLTPAMVWDECERACRDVVAHLSGVWEPREFGALLRRELARHRFPTYIYGTDFYLHVMAYAEGPWVRYDRHRKVWYRSAVQSSS